MGLLVLIGVSGTAIYVSSAAADFVVSRGHDLSVSETTSPQPASKFLNPNTVEPSNAEAQNKPKEYTTNIKDDESEQASEQLSIPTASDSDIRDAVVGWSEAFRARDAAKLAGYYAPEVEQYFRKQNIPRPQIQQYAESSFGRVDSIRRFEITDVNTNVFNSSSRATATFNKQWETSQTDGKTFSGEEIERLTFAMTDEGWKIVREEELDIIRATKQ
jgi:ketosteroid isomerase-like protein